MAKKSVFISHAHRDFRLAKAMSEALRACFGKEIEIGVSSLDGAIPGGDNWVAWIHDQISSCDLAIVLLTPTSIQNPWVLYEAGGVDGVARTNPTTEKRLVPVSFLRQSGDLPDPFKSRAAVSGTDKEKFVLFLRDTINRFRNCVDSSVLDEARERLRDTADTFVRASISALDHTPIERSEALIQEWCDRFDRLLAAKKPEEALSLRRMIGIAFYGESDTRGKAQRAGERFLDFRLHRRFAELYSSRGDHAKAAEEYRLALDFAPRDVYLLHRLGLALVNDEQYEQAKTEALDKIERIDPGIGRESEEIANLRARYHYKQKQIAEAIATLQAYDHRHKSYFVMNNLAIYRMELEGTITESIRQDFQICRNEVVEKAKSDYWARATLINCLLALGEDVEAERQLISLRREPKEGELSTAAKFYDAIIDKRPGGRNGFDWREASLGASVHTIRSVGG